MGHFNKRIVITGIGLTSPCGNSLMDFRHNLLNGTSGVREIDLRFFGKAPAGICDFEETKYRKKKENKKGSRAGCISVYCANEAMHMAGLSTTSYAPSRVGVYIGITEHGTVETENEIYNVSQFDHDLSYWTHHQNPRTVANNPAGEITLNLGITGPHYTIGAACAAGNASLVQGVQMLQLGEVDMALAGGVSEATHSFGIFASFKAQNALASAEDPATACRPFDTSRNGIVVSEGGAVFVLETLENALRRDCKIFGEIVGYAINSDAMDFVLPSAQRQSECMEKALQKAKLNPEDIDIISTHATGTKQGDVEECKAIRSIFKNAPTTYVNNTKSIIGHAMGAAGVLELAGNILSFEDTYIHPTINLTDLDEKCALPNLVINEPVKRNSITTILNNSFGMLGINSAVIVRKYS